MRDLLQILDLHPAPTALCYILVLDSSGFEKFVENIFFWISVLFLMFSQCNNFISSFSNLLEFGKDRAAPLFLQGAQFQKCVTYYLSESKWDTNLFIHHIIMKILRSMEREL